MLNQFPESLQLSDPDEQRLGMLHPERPAARPETALARTQEWA